MRTQNIKKPFRIKILLFEELTHILYIFLPSDTVVAALQNPLSFAVFSDYLCCRNPPFNCCYTQKQTLIS